MEPVSNCIIIYINAFKVLENTKCFDFSVNNLFIFVDSFVAQSSLYSILIWIAVAISYFRRIVLPRNCSKIAHEKEYNCFFCFILLRFLKTKNRSQKLVSS